METQCQRLQSVLPGSLIVSHEIVRGTSKYDLTNFKKKATILRIDRRGKFIGIITDQGILLSHLAMSGFWDLESDPWTFDYVEGKRESSDSDVRIKLGICLEGNPSVLTSRILRFHDTRLFGSLRFYPGETDIRNLPPVKDLGPEALLTPRAVLGAIGWTRDYVQERLTVKRNRDRTIKEFLLDQNEVAGIGNIYATEALWQARLHPETKCWSIPTVISEHVRMGAINTMMKALDKSLRYGEYLRIYRQRKCARCSTSVEKLEIKGRSTYMCPTCQEKP